MKVASGVPGLDAILHGGLPAHRLHLIQGKPGTGKTTFALQFLLEGVRRGERVLYVSLSETAEELKGAAVSHDWNLDEVQIFELSAAEQLTNLDLDQTIFHSSEVELTETSKALLQILDELRPSRVVFDTLSELRLMAGDALRYRKQILILKQKLSRMQSTVLLLNDDPDSGKELQSLVTGVIELDNTVPDFGGNRRHITIMKMRGTAYIGGYHDFAIQHGGLNVFPRLVAAESRALPLEEQFSTGDATFDAMLGGGLDAGTSALIIGPAGSGKSTLVAQVAVTAARRGTQSAMFVFDERPHTLFGRAKSLGMPLQECVDAGTITIQQIDPAELSPGELVHAVQRAVTNGARIIVIDSVVGYLNAMAQERYLVLQLHELLSYLAQAGVLSLLVLGQSHRDTSPLSPVDMSYLADTVIVTGFVSKTPRRSIEVYKRRSGSHEDTARELRIGPPGVTIGEPISEFQSRPDILAG